MPRGLNAESPRGWGRRGGGCWVAVGPSAAVCGEHRGSDGGPRRRLGSDSAALQLEETLQLRTESRQGSLRGDSLRGDSLRGTSICSAMVSSAFGLQNGPAVSPCQSLPAAGRLAAGARRPRVWGGSRGTEHRGVCGVGDAVG